MNDGEFWPKIEVDCITLDSFCVGIDPSIIKIMLNCTSQRSLLEREKLLLAASPQSFSRWVRGIEACMNLPCASSSLWATT